MVLSALLARPRLPLVLASLRIGAILGAFVVVPLLGPHPGNWGSCSNPPSRWGPYLAQWEVVGICFAAFVVGHGLAYLDRSSVPTCHEIVEHTRATPKFVPQDAIVLTLVLVVIVLIAFEWFAVLHPDALFAISFYVRCANWIANGWTAAGAGALTFVMGSWLRFPSWRS